MRFSLSAVVLAALPFAASFVINEELLSLCKSPVLAQQSYIGNVLLSTLQCANLHQSGIHKRQNGSVPTSNVCGAQCDTHCFNPAGGGPDPHDCNVIADALRYDSQDIAEEFNITLDNALFVLQYHSCQSFFVNQANSTDLTYCRSDWADVIDFVAFNCQAQQDAHGGLCVAASQEWFIQIQPFVNASASSSASSSATSSTVTSTPIIPITSSVSSSSVPVNSTSSASSTSSSPSSSVVVVTTTGSSVSVTPSGSTSTASSVSTSTVTPSSTSTSTSTSTESSVSTSTSASVSTTTTASVVTTTSSA